MASSSLLRRAETTLENLAEIVLQGFDAQAMVKRLQDWEPKTEAMSDVLRQRLVNAAKALTAVEISKKNVWEQHDWRETCGAIANELNNGRRVDVAFVKTLLP